MTDQATPARIAAVECQLPRVLPDTYRAFLCEATPAFPALGPWDSTWELTVTGFQREWHPIGKRLLPVEHCGDGIFACLVLHDTDPCPVVAWDIASDLGEQPTVLLAPDWLTYAQGRATLVDGADLGPVIDPLADATAGSAYIRSHAETDLDRRLAAFDLAEKRFHENYASTHAGAQFEHDVEHAQAKATDWRPERFAVQDHLLGVMASRYNKTTNTIDVVGFATRDHTNFARGSATAALLVGLLCDCAAKAAGAVRFLQAIPTHPRDERVDDIPREVVVLSEVLGVGLDPSGGVIDGKEAGHLLLALTPFGALERQALAEAKLNLLRLCLAVHRQIWSPTEAALLARWCPNADDLFGGHIDSGELVRYAAALHHGTAATLVEFGSRVIKAQAELSQSETPQVNPVDWPYGVTCRTTAPTSWTDATSGTPFDIAPDSRLVIIGVPVGGRLAATQVASLEQKLVQASVLTQDETVLAMVPHKTQLDGSGRIVRFVAADRDAADLESLVQQRFQQARRVRS